MKPKSNKKENGAWCGGWHNGRTVTIRVPLALKEQVIQYAKILDALVAEQNLKGDNNEAHS